jgi:hypothetical protein
MAEPTVAANVPIFSKLLDEQAVTIDLLTELDEKVQPISTLAGDTPGMPAYEHHIQTALDRTLYINSRLRQIINQLEV